MTDHADTTHSSWPWLPLLGLLLLGLAGCSATEQPAPAEPVSITTTAKPWLEELAVEAGLEFTALSGYQGRYIFPEIMMGGGALFDIDADGDLDAYLVQSGAISNQGSELGRNQLFRNDGNLSFTDITASSGSDDRAYGMGCAVGDYDSDGLLDLYVTNLGRNTLLRNHGDGTFSDMTEFSGTGETSWSMSAGFLDYDLDGDLDLYVANYINWTLSAEIDCYNPFGMLDYCNPNNYNAPATDTLYRNNADGTFTDVTIEAGLRSAIGNSLGITIGDFDDNGWLDVYVANDTMKNNLWLNQGDGSFSDEAFARGCAVDEHGNAKSGMGVATGDLDDDGDLDLLVGNMISQSDSYYRNDGGIFSDRTALIGLGTIGRRYTRYGLGFADFDNDGWLDLYEANGNMVVATEPWTDDIFAQPNLLFSGAGGRFKEVEPQAGVAEELILTSRAALFGDLDHDGGIDMIVVSKDGPTQLFHNIVEARGHWLIFDVIDEHGRQALGATVRVALGERTLRRDVISAYGYLAANDLRVHIGLGENAVAEKVTVHWIDGSTEFFGDIEADRIVELRRGSGKLTAADQP